MNVGVARTALVIFLWITVLLAPVCGALGSWRWWSLSSHVSVCQLPSVLVWSCIFHIPCVLGEALLSCHTLGGGEVKSLFSIPAPLFTENEW